MKYINKIRTLIVSFVLITLITNVGRSQFHDVEFKTMQLSYIQTDRAAGILKALGYAVIDFSSEQGPNTYEAIFQPNGPFHNTLVNGYATELENLPLIIVLPETENITLLEMAGEVSATGTSMDVDMGGSSLVYTTTGEPLQRIMVVYDPENPYELSRLINLITNEIDVPAIQVMIEALVIEINSGDRDQLGVRYETQGSLYSSSFAKDEYNTGVLEPFTFILDKSLLGRSHDFRAELSSLIGSESANILSRPSVLVLDGRQARIVVGQQIPTVQTTASSQFATTSTEYIPVGIVLNLRPRVSADRDEITIQVETIISETEETLGSSLSSELAVAPTINSRKVQSYVQVANNTPFIIGGLISNKDTYQEGRVPILSSIPFLGKLFRYKIKKDDSKEVIVVITPHIIDVPDKDFTRVIPKDSKIFQSLENKLFQNNYRIQNTDVFDLGFVLNTPLYESVKLDIEEIQKYYPSSNMRKDFNQIKSGSIPGEGILIRRMLYNLVERVEYYKYIDPSKIIYFASSDNDPFNVYTKKFKDTFVKYMDNRSNTALVLSFEEDPGNSHSDENLRRPVASVSQVELDDRYYKKHLKDINDSFDGHAVMLHKNKHERRLYEIFVLRRVLEMNPDIQENIRNFTAGLEILFPSPKTLNMDTHVLDNEIAQYFYEVNDYNNAFDKDFLKGIRQLQDEIAEYE